jgi:hypothetical protein
MEGDTGSGKKEFNAEAQRHGVEESELGEVKDPRCKDDTWGTLDKNGG